MHLLPCEPPYAPGAPEFRAHHGSFVHAYIEGCSPLANNTPEDLASRAKSYGVEPPGRPFSIAVYPNPTHEKVTVVNKSPDRHTWQIEIENSLGSTVYQQTNVPFSQTSIDVSGFPKGVYFVRAMKTDESCVSKLVLE